MTRQTRSTANKSQNWVKPGDHIAGKKQANPAITKQKEEADFADGAVPAGELALKKFPEVHYRPRRDELS